MKGKIMRHQYVIVGLLSVICGLLGYIAAQVTVDKPETSAANVQQAEQIISHKAATVTPPNTAQKAEYVEGGEIIMQVKYPKNFAERVIEGTSKIEVFVDENGQINKAWIVQSGGTADIDKFALKESKKASYTPKIVDGKAVKTRYVAVYQYDYRFN